ncbi:D-alanyl-D-alanine carboxypeptidase [Halalkalibacter wakoensis JCM 9140]|uniref:D-alanyl-D-alanine carboxypeptidase n=1 Tax=Halalkalibacter wakoensis JCM 9140 TaxID=1236970 RepID=W4PZM8_9BACI|nr:D-alanyl-D-alanine carboxypeptidase [Halalkalibacter wakoensis JCM 9140]
MRYKFLLSLTIVFFLWQMPFSLAQTHMSQFSQNIEEKIRTNTNLDGALVGISVRQAKTGELLYTNNGDLLLRPASNLKLFTAAVALATLGNDYTFETDLRTDGIVKKEVLHGNLFIQGKGDPTLLESDVERLVKKMKQNGIKAIDGDVIGDDSWYDDIRYSIDLPWSDEMFGYGSAISALTVSPDLDYDAGSVILNISPNQKIGKQANIQLEPKTDYVKVINQTKTVSAEEETDLTFKREHGGNKIIVDGTISVNADEQKETVAVWEPTNYALSIFTEKLDENGIKLIGDVKRGESPEKTKRITNHHSIPLSDLLIPFMKLSNNGHAETLIKEMGKVKCNEGSWEKGLEA